MGARADRVNRWKTIRLLATEASAGRFAFALRLATICSLVAAMVETYRTPEMALTVYVVFFLNKSDRTSSMLTTVGFLVVVSILIGFLLILAEPVLGNPGLRVLVMAMTSFAMLFLASASKLKPLASTIALVLAYALDVMGSAPMGEAATRALLYAWLFVGIPALVSTAVNLLMAPSPRSIVQNEISERLRAAARQLQASRATRNGEGLVLPLAERTTESHLKLAALEKTSPADDIAALRGASDCIVDVLVAVQWMLDEPAALPTLPVQLVLEDKLLELASIYAAGGYPVKVDPIHIGVECSGLAASALNLLNAGLAQLGEPRPGAVAKPVEKNAGFFLTDAFTSPLHAQFSLKVTAAAMLCYVLYSVLSWPGIHTALITCFIVSMGTAAESVEKLTLRIVGCLLGAGLGLFVMLGIVPMATGVGSLMLLVFVGAFLGAWIAGGDPRISYAGFQFAFAYFLCVIQGPSPSFDMVVARDRVIGILLGNAVSYFIATRVWSVSVRPKIVTGLEDLSVKVSGIAHARDGWSRRRLGAEAISLLEDITSAIRLVSYEPAWVRPSRALVVAAQNAVGAAKRLMPPLLGLAEFAPERAASILFTSLPGEDAAVAFVDVAHGHRAKLSALERLVQTRLDDLRHTMSSLAKEQLDA